MSDRDRQKIDEFRIIACDDSITEEDLKTYLTWSKGKVDVALNYYFNRIEKGRIQPVAKKASKHENTKTREQTVAEKRLREGAEKEKRTEDYIRNLKEEYKLPMRTKDFKVEPDRLGNEFSEVDYIPDVLYERNTSVHEEKDGSIDISQKRERVSSTENYVVRSQRTESYGEDFVKQATGVEVPTKQGMIKQSSSMEIEHAIKPQEQTKPKPSTSNLRDIPQGNVNLGQFIINCFSISKLSLKNCQQHDPVVINIFHLNKKEEPKGKKGGKKKVEQKVMMRVVWKGKEIGRLEDTQTSILNGLLDRHIVLETSLVDKLELLDHFKTFRVRAKVMLLKDSLTVPIVETYENRADHNQLLERFGQVRENLMGLFARLGLPISKQPLIRLKSKFRTNKTASKQSVASTSSTISQPTRQQPSKTLQQIHHETVNNPFRQERQQNLSDMFASSKPATSRDQLKESKASLSDQQQPVVREVEIKPEAFSELIDLHEQDLDTADPSDIFISRLHEYQSLALSWMLKRQGKSTIKEEDSLHPMWMEYELPAKGHLYFNEFTGQISTIPPFFKSKCKGGILADQMGLGKTVMLIALMATNRNTNKKCAKNLIVLPLTLLQQWDSEIALHTKPKSLRVLRYYDTADRSKNLLDYDVVLTTYGVVSQQFAQGNHITNVGLYKHEWHRIILDEAHYIKGRVIQTARAVFTLRSQINWCLTGTPIQNKLDDLFALLHFIKYTPWSDYQWWNTYINKPHEQGDPVVFEVLRTILRKVLLRRTKQSRRRDGQPIITLPEKVSKIAFLKLGNKERQFYDAVYEASKKEFDELADHGIVEAKFMKIFEILMRLRQICCHPALFRSVTKFSTKEDFPKELRKWLDKRLEQRNAGEKGSRFELLMEEDGREVRIEIGPLTYNDKHLHEVLTRISDNPNEMCSICLDPMENPVITVCLHTYCRSCLVRSIETIAYCPECRSFLSKDDFTCLPRQNRLGISLEKEFRPSTKMEALMGHLKLMGKDEKAVVFSQFLGMIDLIEEHMRQEGITHVRMDGSLSQRERSSVIDRFKNDPGCQVFIISLKSGGVGLNLVAANKVFMVDPWWNPAVEEQAIERVHRIGQKRKVEVVRFIVENSIESRMMELHESKRNISAMAISERESKETSIEKFRYLMSKY